MDEIEYEMMLLTRHVTRLPGHSRRTGGQLDHSAYLLLSYLDVAGPLTLRELTEATGLETSTLSRQTNALLRDAHAERVPDPAGGLARKFRITALGRRVLGEERAAGKESLGRVMSDWSARDRAAFAGFLERFNRGIESRTGRTAPRPER